MVIRKTLRFSNKRRSIIYLLISDLNIKCSITGQTYIYIYVFIILQYYNTKIDDRTGFLKKKKLFVLFCFTLESVNRSQTYKNYILYRICYIYHNLIRFTNKYDN